MDSYLVFEEHQPLRGLLPREENEICYQCLGISLSVSS